MDNFIFSIKEIFDDCLKHHKVDGYFIGPYQRGYKWKSSSIYDHIPVLLTDLYEAYLKSEHSKSNNEYFIQYITVKKRLNEDKRSYSFELIDGQQRLTTLTLLYSVLEHFFKAENLAKRGNKFLLSYSRYDEPIFDEVLSLLCLEDVDSISIHQQDKYYMFEAAKCIRNFFNILKGNEAKQLDSFLEYLAHNVKIILNKEDEFTSSEEVFSSLNANKVPLTNSYLIKGLLLTKASRTLTEGHRTKHFKEIMDERSIMGRTWDEMNSWFSQPEVALFFFGSEQDGMENMLRLIEFEKHKVSSVIIDTFRKLYKDGTKYETTYKLFNEFHDHILTPEDSLLCLERVKHTYKRLRNWYDDVYIHNYLGYYYQITSDNGLVSTKKLLNKDNCDLILYLKEKLRNAIPNSEDGFKELKYNNKKDKEIKRVLLALSVFPEEIETKNQFVRFNFYAYSKENWTLEHIFPQNPNLKEYNIKDDKDWIVSRLSELLKKLSSIEDKVKKESIENTIAKIYLNDKIAVNEINDVVDDIEENNLGNMALLSGGVNSALSNGFFNTKRRILLSKLNQGYFVPRHTIDIFSKMLPLPKEMVNEVAFDLTLTMWSDNDIKAHCKFIIHRVLEIQKKLSI
ncbi:MAG: DUF262 domain-containing protein [Bacteroidales bacterium]